MAAYGADIYGTGIYGEGGPRTWPGPDSGSTTPPLLGGSLWERAQQSGGIAPWYSLTVTVPGGEPQPLYVDWDSSFEVTHQLDQPRFQCSVAVARDFYVNVEQLVSTPAARFHLRAGWQSQGQVLSDIGMGVYELAQSPSSSITEQVTLALQDLWKVIEEMRFPVPRAIAAGPRITRIKELVEECVPGVTFIENTDGGTTTGFTVERDRGDAIMQLAQGGDMLVGFDGDGNFVFDPNPLTGPEPASAVTLLNGPAANVTALAAEAKYERWYNAVATVPQDGQVWTAKTFAISDPTHPRWPGHPGMGIRPFFITVPGAATQAAADNAAQARLSAVVGTVELAKAETWARGDLRAGQFMTILTAETWATSSSSRKFLIDTLVYDVLKVGTTLSGRSAVEVPSEEV